MLDKIERRIINDAKKLASSNRKLPSGITKEVIKRDLPILIKPLGTLKLLFLTGGATSLSCSRMLHASYTDQFKSLFTDKQRSVLAKKAAMGVISICVGFVFAVTWIVRIAISN